MESRAVTGLSPPGTGRRVPAAIWLLAKAASKLLSMPMTSPVERISGPSKTSTPPNLTKGNTASLTAMCLGDDLVDAHLAQGAAGRDLGRDLGQRHPDDLGHEGHRARGARVHLKDEDAAAIARHRELHVHQAAHVQLARQGARLVFDDGHGFAGQGEGRQAAGRVARVDAGLLDVLHHAANDHVLTVGHHVHVDLDGVAQELVHQDGRALVALAAARGQALAPGRLQGHAHEGVQARQRRARSPWPGRREHTRAAP